MHVTCVPARRELALGLCCVLWSKTCSQRGRFLLLLEELDLLWDVSLVRKHYALLPGVGDGAWQAWGTVPSHWSVLSQSYTLGTHVPIHILEQQEWVPRTNALASALCRVISV